MSLRFFADQCISNYIIDTLQTAGHKVFRLKEHISPDSPDSIVIQKAKELVSILISLNGDFADIVMYPPSDYKGIFALQIRNHPEIIPQLMQRLLNYLTGNPNMDYYSGKLFLIEVHRIRIKQ
jgi:predicted nuclease of predicted toxin-antitoxin system